MSKQPIEPPLKMVNFVKKTVTFEILVPEGFEVKESRITSAYPSEIELQTTVNLGIEYVGINVNANVILHKNKEDTK